MKKIVSILLVLCMVVACATTAFASSTFTLTRTNLTKNTFNQSPSPCVKGCNCKVNGGYLVYDSEMNLINLYDQDETTRQWMWADDTIDFDQVKYVLESIEITDPFETQVSITIDGTPLDTMEPGPYTMINGIQGYYVDDTDGGNKLFVTILHELSDEEDPITPITPKPLFPAFFNWQKLIVNVLKMFRLNSLAKFLSCIWGVR